MTEIRVNQDIYRLDDDTSTELAEELRGLEILTGLTR